MSRRKNNPELDAGSGSSAGSGKGQPSQGGGLESNLKIAGIVLAVITAVIGIALLVG